MKNTTRRKFMQSSVIGIGSLAIPATVINASDKGNSLSTPVDTEKSKPEPTTTSDPIKSETKLVCLVCGRSLSIVTMEAPYSRYGLVCGPYYGYICGPMIHDDNLEKVFLTYKKVTKNAGYLYLPRCHWLVKKEKGRLKYHLQIISTKNLQIRKEKT